MNDSYQAIYDAPRAPASVLTVRQIESFRWSWGGSFKQRE